MTKVTFLLLLFTVISGLESCVEKKTRDPSEVYRLWSGTNKLPKGVKPIHGYYWQSAHWSKEYMMYLELKAPASWRSEFIKQNNLILLGDTSIIPDPDIPEWFEIDKRYRIYVLPEKYQTSVYYEDTVNDRLFLHEVQL